MSDSYHNELKKVSLYEYMENRIKYYKEQYDKAWRTAINMESDRDKYIGESIKAEKQRDQYRELLIEACRGIECELCCSDYDILSKNKAELVFFMDKPEIKELLENKK